MLKLVKQQLNELLNQLKQMKYIADYICNNVGCDCQNLMELEWNGKNIKQQENSV